MALKIPKRMAVVASPATWATRLIALLAAPARLRISLSIGQPGKHRTLQSSLRRTMASASAATPPPSGGVEKVTAPYGSWKSPITADVVAGADKRLGGIAVGGDGRLVWIETRPEEGGNQQNWKINQQMLYLQNLHHEPWPKSPSPVPITPDYGGPLVCYADGNFDPHFSRYITVMEDHRKSNLNPSTTIACIHLNDVNIQEPKELVSGNDFYAFPRVDPSGKRIAWIEWSHPSMPWDKAELWVGYFSENGELSKRICVAGGDPTIVESPTEPKWSPKGKNKVVAVYPFNAEFTRPLWVFGISSYDFIGKDGENDNIVCTYRQNGRSYIGILDSVKGSFLSLDIHLTDIGNIVFGSCCLYMEGASATHPLSIVKVTLDASQSKAIESSVLWSSSPDLTKYEPYFSLPEIIEFPTECPGQNAYAYFYPPSNPIYQACSDEKPPLLVKSHGGPTSESHCILDLNIQYWTSRGWAFVDVNYGGSTGYGREYRERLLRQWGIVDVNDCCSCARFLVECGKVDGERLCITGRSAGGYTTLACLAFRETFKAGASLYGVADLTLLKAETHKFESYYLDNLVGSENAYFERSPINFVDKFTCPVILFQGLEDKVVPPVQARKIYKALMDKGLPVALVEYEGEQHGFRKAENIKFTLEQQMMFFARLVGHFQVADPISPIKIDNFD
ncbi:Dienelactone hydrolase family [Musa troglodytarum]|uniref:Dienelactone hydrolase family n=1 Tax=Musa troglodytarum TaxID=320322 RepID=A0A9E7HX32_9LILI|nr:Dienelactone hydrolase family [Musa troglodytarum]